MSRTALPKTSAELARTIPVARTRGIAFRGNVTAVGTLGVTAGRPTHIVVSSVSSLVSEMAAAADRSDRCRYLRLRPRKPVRQIAVAWRKGRSRPIAAVRFIAALTERLGAGRHAAVRSP